MADHEARELPVVGSGGPAGDGGSSDGNRPLPDDASSRVSRRTVLKLMAAAAALPTLAAEACEPGTPDPSALPAPASNPLASGTAWDPDLIAPTVSWEGVLTESEMRTARALCDVIIPADNGSPAASTLGVPEFIDEWIGAPYPAHRREQVRIRGGLLWLDTESVQRFGAGFADLTLEQQRAICDDICYVPDAAPEHRAAALFFDRFRDLTSTGFWTTEEGMADLGFVGNVPLASFDGPPREILERLGLV